jgi:hypothetical protein
MFAGAGKKRRVCMGVGIRFPKRIGAFYGCIGI